MTLGACKAWYECSVYFTFITLVFAVSRSITTTITPRTAENAQIQNQPYANPKNAFFLLLCPIRNLSLTVALNFNLTLARTLTLTITITITTTSTSTITITVTLGLSLGVFRELLCVQDDFGGWNLSLALELRV